MDNIELKYRNLKDLGEKANHEVHLMLTRTEKERLKMLTKSANYGTMSKYIKDQIFRPEIHHKLDLILKILLDKKSGKKEEKQGNGYS